MFTRHPDNPIVSPDQIPGGANCVFNSGATLFRSQIVLLLSCWINDWSSRFFAAFSDDGVSFKIAPRNLISPPREYPYYPYGGIFDTRIASIDGRFYVTHNVASRRGGRIMLSVTDDFETISELGFITGPDHRNCVLFPERIQGDFVRLERPTLEDGSGDIYLSRSPDLIHWGRTELLLERGNRYWESAKIGPGPTPIKTPKGWLVIYHGCRKNMNGYQYNAGCMMLDLDDPLRVIGKLRAPILCPETQYERVGNVGNVVFPTGAIVKDGELYLYYGAADSAMCLAKANLLEVVEACLADGELSNDEPAFPRKPR